MHVIHEHVQQAFAEMEQLGLLEKNGEFRDGQPVWVTTALGKYLEEEAPDLLELLVTQGPTDAL